MADENHIPAPWCPRAQDSTGWASGSSGSERPETTAALSRRFPGWIIMFDAAAAIYTAEKREGTALHVLAAHRPSDLAIKIEAAQDPADVDDDVPCEPNNLSFCRWCGRDMTP